MRVPGSTKEVREVLQFGLNNGFELVKAKRHFVLRREGKIVSVSMSPRDGNAMKNAMRDIQRVIKEIENGASTTRSAGRQ